MTESAQNNRLREVVVNGVKYVRADAERRPVPPGCSRPGCTNASLGHECAQTGREADMTPPGTGDFPQHGVDELPHDSLFERVHDVMTMTGCATRDRCKGCGEYVSPNSESRSGHLNGGCEAWEAHCRGEAIEGWGDTTLGTMVDEADDTLGPHLGMIDADEGSR